jgi:hypothetical protein
MSLPIQKESSGTWLMRDAALLVYETGQTLSARLLAALAMELSSASQSDTISTYLNSRRPIMLKELLTLVILYLRSTLKSAKALAALRKLAPVLIEARDLLDEVIQTIPVETQAKARKLYLKGTDEHLF